MKIPEGMTESQVTQIIQDISYKLGPKFRFGYHTNEDMYQYAFIYGIKGLENYDKACGSLEAFMWTHIRNRLYNFKRDNYQRLQKPCDACPLNAYINKKCTAYNDLLECKYYKIWYNNNTSKKNITHPIEITHVDDSNENSMYFMENMADLIDRQEMMQALEDGIPLHLRNLWIKIKNGISLIRPERLKIMPIIIEILKEKGFIDDDTQEG